MTLSISRTSSNADSVSRPRYSLDELLEQCDENVPVDVGDRAWLEARPVGNELL